MNMVVLPTRHVSLAESLIARGAFTALRRNGFVTLEVDHGFLAPRFDRVIRGLRAITDDPILGSQLQWTIHETDAYGPKYAQEVGLRLDDGIERKWKFQYSSVAYKNPWNHGFAPQICELFETLGELEILARELAMAVAACVDKENRRKSTMSKYPGSLVERLRLGRVVTRGLRYRQTAFIRPDAVPHVDRSAFSAHWGSTHAGLVMFTPDQRQLRIDETSRSAVAVFPGEKFAACTRGLYGFGTPHGVRDERTLEERTDDRFALVSFVHPVSRDEDAAWLLKYRDEIEAMERQLRC